MVLRKGGSGYGCGFGWILGGLVVVDGPDRGQMGGQLTRALRFFDGY